MLLLLVSACHFDPSTATPDQFQAQDGGNVTPGSADADVGPDADPDAPDAAPPPCVGDQLNFALLNMGPCDPPQSSGPLRLFSISGSYKLNTGNGQLTTPFGGISTLAFEVVPQTQAGGPDLFVVTVDDFVMGPSTSLEITGPRPFVLISTSSIIIDGTVSVAGRGSLSGAGGDISSQCGTGRGSTGAMQTDDDNNQGGSGGGGGGFGTAGGSGAKVDGADASDVAGGEVSAIVNLIPLRGGCAGGPGGLSGGAGGGAGGAMQLIANTGFIVTGVLSASGGGGGGVSDSNSGGGGGGSGGGILVQAAMWIPDNGEFTINGGGGSEGSHSNTSSDPGDDGSIANENPAAGGTSGGGGGSGGAGGTPSNSVQDGNQGASDDNGAAGGGGGGGAPGRFRAQILVP